MKNCSIGRQQLLLTFLIGSIGLAGLPVLAGEYNLDGATAIDVGNPRPVGSTAPMAVGADLTAGGLEIGGSSDQFHFLYQPVAGDFDVRTRLESIENTDLWAKGGLMLREGLATGSRFAGVFATPTLSGCSFQSRLNANATSTSSGNLPVNYPYTWLRLQRQGDVVSGYAGCDGTNWVPMGTMSLGTNQMFLGLAATSHNTNRATVARFRDIGDAVAGTNRVVDLAAEPLGPSSRRTGLVISEIMYHPAARADGKNLEFIEIFNSEPIFMNLGGYRLTGSIDYTFPSNQVIAAGGFLVVARAPSDVASAYGINGVLGGWTGPLPGNSGTVRLQNSFGAILLEVQYASDPPWPVAADGAGHSLVLARPSYGENDPAAWAASQMAGGSPGTTDPAGVSPLRAIRINEILANSGPAALDFVELYNHGNQAVDLGACILTDDVATNRYVFPANTPIPPGGFVVLYQNELGFGLKSAGDTVFLFSPDRSRVVDAVRIGGQASGVSAGRFPDGAADFRELKTPTPGTSNRDILIRDLVINEIMFNPISGNDDDQFVELYNRGTQALNISGWRFSDGIDFTFPAGTLVPADGYVVVARNAARLRASYPLLTPANTVGDFAGKLSKRKERLALAMAVVTVSTNANDLPFTNTFYVVVNEVTYGAGGRWGQWADGGGSSLELIDARSDNRLASNWADSDETAKAPWTLIEHTGTLDLGVGAVDSLHLLLCGVGECLVDNVEVWSEGGTTNHIANATFTNGISGWSMQGTHERSSLETTEGFDDQSSLHVRADGRGDTGANRIRSGLRSPLPVVGKTATIRARARWLRGERGILLRFHGNWLEAAGQLAVPANLGTPGTKNSRALPNAGPAIHDVVHSPILPAAQQPVLVTAQVYDPDGVTNLVLNYRVDPDNNLVSVPMTDDGLAGDAVANDGIYSATIPGQDAGVIVAFQVQATDHSSAPATTLFPADAPVHECLVRFGETQPFGNLGVYHVWMTRNTTVGWNNRLKLHNTPLNATFVYGNSRVIYQTGAGYAGSPWVRPNYTGPVGALCGYELEFPSDDRFLGDTGLTLDYPVRDDTLQLEQVAYWMADQMGIANNHRRTMVLVINGSRRGRIYEDTQRPDKDICQEFYANAADGDLFKLDDGFEFDARVSTFERDNGDTAATLENFTTTGGVKKTARYRWHWRKRAETGSPHDYTSLFGLVDAMNAPNDTYVSQVESLVDVDQWMRAFTVEHMVGNWDSYGYYRGKNMFAYKPVNGKWQMLPWDIDFVMSAQGNPANDNMLGTVDPVLSRMFNQPSFTRAFYQAIRQAVDGPLVAANVEPLLDAKYAALVANGISAASPNAAKTYIRNRRGYLISSYLDQVRVDFARVANDGDSFSTDNNWVELRGRAPIELKTITINGIAYPLTWISSVDWTVRYPLSAATNRVVIQGFDLQGNLWTNNPNPLTIHYTGSLEQPQDHLVINEIMYHPTLPGTEFVEIFNTSTNCVFDLSQYRLEGLAFTFAPGTVIGPRAYMVVVQDRVLFRAAYGSAIDIAGEYPGQLSQTGETVRLVKPGALPADDLVIDEVSYRNQFPWPGAADGQGGSLQLLDPAQDHQRPNNWGAISAVEAAQPGWRFVSVTGVASTNSHLLIYHSPYQEPRPYNDLSGDWHGSMDVYGTPYEFSPNFQKQGNSWTGMVYNFFGSDFPLNTIKVNTNYVQFGFNDSSSAILWTGRLSPDGRTITGTYTQPNYSFPFTMNRVMNPEDYPGGEVYLDDLMLVAGSVPEAGTNLVNNGDFEAPLADPWQVASNHLASVVTHSYHHSGQTSLRLVADFGGQDEQSAVWQSIDGLVPGQTYSLSYWYLPSNQGRELTVRLADSDLSTTRQFRAPTAATPGAPNSIPPNEGVMLSLFLTEVQPENVAGVQDAQGHRTAWVEMYNAGTNAVSLQGCYLSASSTNLLQWAFPTNSVIQPGRYQLAWLDAAGAETTATEWHASFLASPTNGLVVLSLYQDGQAIVLDSLAYQQVPAGQSYGWVDHHQEALFTLPTPGQSNQSGVVTARILINEWMANNTHTLIHPSATTFPDWFELYNPSPVAVDLSGFFLTDNLSDKTKCSIPAGTRIGPGGFLLVWADNNLAQNGAQDELHANFQLSKQGEVIGLYSPSGALVDSVSFGPQIADVSQGRWPDGSESAFVFMTTPTPGMPNSVISPENKPKITGCTVNPTQQWMITLTTAPGPFYQLQFKNVLTDLTWQNAGSPVKASGTALTLTDPSADTPAQRFYRIAIVEVTP